MSVGPNDSHTNLIIYKMSVESFATTAAFPVRVGYRLEDINQTLCYENEEESSKLHSYCNAFQFQPIQFSGLIGMDVVVNENTTAVLCSLLFDISVHKSTIMRSRPITYFSR